MNKVTLAHSTQEHGLQIGIDALLLSAFILHCKPTIKHFVELGVGDGMASCSLAMNMPEAHGFGIDITEEAILAAKANAQNLGLDARLHFQLADVAAKKNLASIYHERTKQQFADMVMTNPPYHKQGTGRVSVDIKRRIALHQHENTLQYFCAAAASLLKHHGHFFCIYAPNHLYEILNTCHEHNLGIRHILPIHSRPNRAAQWLLIHAQKHAKNDVHMLAHMSIYATVNTKQLSAEILEFCPWIA